MQIMTNTSTYQHPYGGVAWDIEVKPERFAKLFGTTVERLPDLPTNEKIGDKVVEDHGRMLEILGYVFTRPAGRQALHHHVRSVLGRLWEPCEGSHGWA